MVDPGGDVAAGGRVLGAYVLDIAASDAHLWVVDDREHPDSKLLEAIIAQGHQALSIDPTDSSAAEKILSKLGEY